MMDKGKFELEIPTYGEPKIEPAQN